MPNDWILLIDPFQNLLNAYRVILEDQGYLVESATSLKDFLRSFPSAILRCHHGILFTFRRDVSDDSTDKQMHPETSIIMVTNATVDDTSYEKLFDAGLEDIILKPYSLRRSLSISKRFTPKELDARKRGIKKQADSSHFAEEFQI